jgi:hypothetical protein
MPTRLVVAAVLILSISRLPLAAADAVQASPAQREIAACLAAIDRVERNLPQITKVAETIAARHLKGGHFGCPLSDQPVMAELTGRSGNFMYFGLRAKEERPDEHKQQDVAIVAYDKPAGKRDADTLKKLKDRGVWIVGMGPKSLQRAECHIWIETCDEPGLRGVMSNAITGWALMAELTAAITRQGKMPIIHKSHASPEGVEWAERYRFKQQPFHTDLKVAPIAAGELGQALLRQYREHFQRLNIPQLRAAASKVAEELRAGRKTVVAWQGHMPQLYVGRYGTESWAVAAQLHPRLDSQIQSYVKKTPDEALVLSLGYQGLDPKGAAVWREKKQRVIHLAGEHPDAAWRDRSGLIDWINLGFAFGDACVTIESYPARAFAASGVTQLAAYMAVDAEVRALAVPAGD